MGVAVHLVVGMNVGMTRDCDLAGSVRSWAAASSTTAKKRLPGVREPVEEQEELVPGEVASCRHVAMTAISATDLTRVRPML